MYKSIPFAYSVILVNKKKNVIFFLSLSFSLWVLYLFLHFVKNLKHWGGGKIFLSLF